jgi:hypothetical protein
MESKPLRGRCLCGAIELALEPPTDFLSICHCRSCRVSHGAPMVAWTSVPRERFTIVKGEPRLRWFRSSRWIRWGFCDTCGSRLLYVADAEGHPESPKTDRIYVAAACLEGELDRPLEAHVSYEERVPWFDFTDALPKYRGKGVERIE